MSGLRVHATRPIGPISSRVFRYLCSTCVAVMDDLFAELADQEKHGDPPAEGSVTEPRLPCLFCGRQAGPAVQTRGTGAAICAACFSAGQSGHLRPPTDARLAQVAQRALDQRRQRQPTDAPHRQEAWRRAKERVKQLETPRTGDVELAMLLELRRLTGESDDLDEEIASELERGTSEEE